MDGNSSTLERAASSYWAKYLADAKSCQFPRSGIDLEGKQQVSSINVELEQLQRLQTLATDDETKLVGVLHAAWALVLHCYTGSEDVCFGHQETKHTTRPDGGRIANGEESNMSVARFRLDETTSLTDLIDRAKLYYTRGLQYFDAMPAEIAESLHSSEKRLFNTTVLLAKIHGSGPSEAVHAPSPLDVGKLIGVRLPH